MRRGLSHFESPQVRGAAGVRVLNGERQYRVGKEGNDGFSFQYRGMTVLATFHSPILPTSGLRVSAASPKAAIVSLVARFGEHTGPAVLRQALRAS